MDNFQIQIIIKLALALVLGALIGLEREYKKKEAGLQTYSLVTLGACLFTVIAIQLFFLFKGNSINFDPSRIILAVATGIGFIGAGVIIQREARIEGITTAAGLWTVAAIGVAVGGGFYFLALIATLLTIIILVGLGKIERKLFKKD